MPPYNTTPASQAWLKERGLYRSDQSWPKSDQVAPDPSAEVKQGKAEASWFELRECAVRDQESAHEEESVDGDGAAEDQLSPQRRGVSIIQLQYYIQKKSIRCW